MKNLVPKLIGNRDESKAQAYERERSNVTLRRDVAITYLKANEVQK